MAEAFCRRTLNVFISADIIYIHRKFAVLGLISIWEPQADPIISMKFFSSFSSYRVKMPANSLGTT